MVSSFLIANTPLCFWTASLIFCLWLLCLPWSHVQLVFKLYQVSFYVDICVQPLLSMVKTSNLVQVLRFKSFWDRLLTDCLASRSSGPTFSLLLPCLISQKCNVLKNLQWLPIFCWTKDLFLSLTVKALHNRIITYFSRLFSHYGPHHAWCSSQLAVPWAWTVPLWCYFLPEEMLFLLPPPTSTWPFPSQLKKIYLPWFLPSWYSLSYPTAFHLESFDGASHLLPCAHLFPCRANYFSLLVRIIIDIIHTEKKTKS